jgi:hypothetical protein
MEKRDYSKAMMNVRKAFRLLYEYQQCMQSLVGHIKSKYGFGNGIVGYKRFSDPIFSGHNDGYGTNLKIDGVWAWDFLYSYQFEYFIGEQQLNEINENTKEFDTVSMSIIQVSDNGFYLKDSIIETEVDEFEDVNKSESFLIFVCQKVERTSLWKNAEYLNDIIKDLASGSKDFRWIAYKGNKTGLLAKRYLIEDFYNQVSTDEKLKDFSDDFYKKTAVRLLKENN